MLFLICCVISVIWIYYFLFRGSKKDIDPKNKAILITGAASGIGKATALQLVKEGCFVYAADVNEKLLKENFGKMENVKIIDLDVTSVESIKAAKKIIKKEGKGLYGIVNSAGIASAVPIGVIKYVVELSEKELTRVIEINLLGTMRVNAAFHKFLKTSKGCYVNIASVAGRMPLVGLAPYSASKHGVEGYSKTMRCELKPFGIRVVVIEPGFIATPLVENYYDAKWDFSKTHYKLDGVNEETFKKIN